MKNYSISAFIVAIVVAAFVGFMLGRYVTARPYVSQAYPDIGGVSGSALGYLKDSKTVSSLAVRATLVGKITAIDNDGIRITKEGSPAVTVTFNKDTIIFEASQLNTQAKNIKRENLNIGDLVTVIGNLNGNELVADTVIKGKTAAVSAQ